MKKKKLKKNRSASPVSPGPSPDACQEILALEKDIRKQVHDLEKALAPQSRPQADRKPQLPFPSALGKHLLQRLLALEAAADRLASQAERQGDYKTALRAIQVSTRVINTTLRLVAKHPHLGEDWQPETTMSRPSTPGSPQFFDATQAAGNAADALKAVSRKVCGGGGG